MSRSDPLFHSDLAASIDRLVANELGNEARRALILQLETTPDGWRRCALTFLEDQAWRSALAPPEALFTRSTLVPPAGEFTRSRITSTSRRRYAVAAGLAGLFALVSFRAGTNFSERKSTVGVTAVLPAAKLVEPSSSPGRPLGWVDLINPAEGEAMPRRIPILEATEANARWLEQQPATVPDYVRAQWERRGFRVEENHRLMGLDLKDGRRVAIPVDEVALDYVGRQPL